MEVQMKQRYLEDLNYFLNCANQKRGKKLDKKFPNETIHSSPKKINKKLMCEIQILLDKGKSIRSIASMVDIAESTIRSWIIKKLLRR